MPLSADTEVQIAAQFLPDDAARVREMLLECASICGVNAFERVTFDILHLAAGDPLRVRRLVDVAKRDPRDVMAAEYHWLDGRSVPRDWALRHPVNQRLKAKQNSET